MEVPELGHASSYLSLLCTLPAHPVPRAAPDGHPPLKKPILMLSQAAQQVALRSSTAALEAKQPLGNPTLPSPSSLAATAAAT